MVHEDFDRCYRAVRARDTRFDGWFVTAVTTTRIYCRPSCPARTPFPQNVRFYPTAAAAQQAGFRACKRCRPDAAPGSPEWNERGDIVARAMRLIADGTVDREGVTGLAAKLGYSSRQLQRVLGAELGAGPIALARAQRAQTARILIETTTLGFADVAFAAGFSSVRQFNDTIRSVFDATPSALRARARRRLVSTTRGAFMLRLPVRTPFTADSLFGHLVSTAIPGCEEYRDGAYRRTLRLTHGHGIVSLRPRADHVACHLVLDDGRDLTAAIARCRRLLDLDADPEATADLLGDDPSLGPLVRKGPGRRIPRTVDEVEMAVRIVLGQQVSTAAARTHGARLVAAHGTPITDADGGLTHLFPSVDQLASIDPEAVAVPRARQRCLTVLASRVSSGTIELGPGADWERARHQLSAIEGIGEWTCEMIAMRGLGDPDAFPRSDLGVRTSASQLALPATAVALSRHARRWRPWRSYAVQYLWSALDHPINHWPPKEQP